MSCEGPPQGRCPGCIRYERILVFLYGAVGVPVVYKTLISDVLRAAGRVMKAMR